MQKQVYDLKLAVIYYFSFLEELLKDFLGVEMDNGFV